MYVSPRVHRMSYGRHDTADCTAVASRPQGIGGMPMSEDASMWLLAPRDRTVTLGARAPARRNNAMGTRPRNVDVTGTSGTRSTASSKGGEHAVRTRSV